MEVESWYGMESERDTMVAVPQFTSYFGDSHKHSRGGGGGRKDIIEQQGRPIGRPCWIPQKSESYFTSVTLRVEVNDGVSILTR